MHLIIVVDDESARIAELFVNAFSARNPGSVCSRAVSMESPEDVEIKVITNVPSDPPEGFLGCLNLASVGDGVESLRGELAAGHRVEIARMPSVVGDLQRQVNQWISGCGGLKRLTVVVDFWLKSESGGIVQNGQDMRDVGDSANWWINEIKNVRAKGIDCYVLAQTQTQAQDFVDAMQAVGVNASSFNPGIKVAKKVVARQYKDMSWASLNSCYDKFSAVDRNASSQIPETRFWFCEHGQDIQHQFSDEGWEKQAGAFEAFLLGVCGQQDFVDLVFSAASTSRVTRTSLHQHLKKMVGHWSELHRSLSSTPREFIATPYGLSVIGALSLFFRGCAHGGVAVEWPGRGGQIGTFIDSTQASQVSSDGSALEVGKAFFLLANSFATSNGISVNFHVADNSVAEFIVTLPFSTSDCKPNKMSFSDIVQSSGRVKPGKMVGDGGSSLATIIQRVSAATGGGLGDPVRADKSVLTFCFE